MLAQPLVAGNAADHRHQLPPRRVDAHLLPSDIKGYAAERVGFLVNEGADASGTDRRETANVVTAEQRRQVSAGASDVIGGDQRVHLASAEAGLQAVDWRTTGNARQPIAHVVQQDLQAGGGVGAGEKALSVAVVLVRTAGQDVPKIGGKDGVGQITCEHFAARGAVYEDRGRARASRSFYRRQTAPSEAACPAARRR